ncbi:hypothetical protein [Enterococcus faecium]|uniref:hypothetical protein n=1 Tax=Enterococcus faecium TaxID=1352 RepID=UPI000330ABFA|nr:hypothetical protein [Enterococcus faecium]EOH43272.1 hypothetical protein SSG_02352 [Enterococcus faecium EnGen0190]EOH45666.1 hypothetical protein SSI_01706 [Enterococcus faecium EnGen0191]
MSDLIISFIATVVFCLVVGGAILLVSWLAGIFGEAVIMPIALFILLWFCAYCLLQE